MSSEQQLEILARKRDSLRSTVKVWLARVEHEPRLRRMTSQTRAVTTLLQSLMEKLDTELLESSPAVERIEGGIVASWQFWNGYRAKFSQREEEAFEKLLRPADELAWQCYKPARNAALAPDSPFCKEPPLVYFSADASPLIDPRESRHPDGIPTRVIEIYKWPAAAAKLPFALVGIPWFTLGFLPGALAIAHEVGHAVYFDFALDEQLESVLQRNPAIDDANKSHWIRWSGEMFADLWGCLALGPAFAKSLSTRLLSRTDDHNDDNLFSEYPPDALRVWWNTSILSAQSFGDELKEISAAWEPVRRVPRFSDLLWAEARIIAESWLSEAFDAFNGKKLTDILSFAQRDHDDARAQAEFAITERALSHADIRVLWAAVEYAFAAQPTERILNKILAVSGDERRAPGLAETEKSRADRDAQIRRSALDLI